MASPETSLNSPARHAGAPAAQQCYLAAILYIAEAIDAISPEIGAVYRESLLSLQSRLPKNCTSEELEESRAALYAIVQDFCEKARLQKQALARDLSQTISMVARSRDDSAGRNIQYVARLVDFVERIEASIHSADLPRLAQETSALRDFSHSIELDSHDDFGQLRQKMREMQRRLHEVELLATLDPLTGVANRRDLERELGSRIEARRDFCVLLFDLDNFKQINDRHGHLAGDEVLKQLAARLGSQVRGRDYVCRWGGDEFIAILACDLGIAGSRARQIAGRLNGSYRISADGQEILVHVAVTVGLVQYHSGESHAQILRRVDESMYAHKHSFPAG